MEYKTENNQKIIKVKHDGSITLATGKNRHEKHWKNKTMIWSELVKKLSVTTRTPETHAEYKKMSKSERDGIKDVGGFVGGSLKNGRRKAENVANRTLLTLDLDYVKGDIWSSIELLWDFSVVMYSTHTHTPDNPRLRLVIPLSRPILPDEYQAIGRMVADDLGIDQFDDTTYQSHRLMYWPSTSSDGIYEFKFQDGNWLDADEVLKRYPDWKDISYWPESSRARAHIDTQIKRQEDPLTKMGIIGAFCRTYSISEAMDAFLSDVYAPGADETRYTYIEGSTSGGVVVYEDKFSYSHHGTDPASEILCNAFDLVRIHKFGYKDDSVRVDTKSNNLPSFKEMSQFAINDDKVKIQLGRDRISSAKDEFGIVEDDSDEWLTKLQYTQQGAIRKTIDNVKIILENDPRLKGKFAYNEFTMRKTTMGALPWNPESKTRAWGDNSDSDDSGIRHYLEKAYDITRSAQVINDAVNLVFNENKFHPVRDYLRSLEWDGIKRIDTLLINYFGAEDNIYTKAATRIFLCGGVARIFHPGCQLDYVLTLAGPQGIRKGTFYRIMAKNDEWYTELNTIKPKEAIEETMGKWIVEMAEMTPTRKSEVDEMKAFITNKTKTVRLAYARNPTDIPRQYVLAASNNNSAFLKDPTGDRRYFPVDADMNKATKSIKTDLAKEVDQLWAEAMVIYEEKGNEALQLTDEEKKLAEIAQDNHRIVDDEEGSIIEYLNTPLPKDWYEKDLYQRQRYFNDNLEPKVNKEDGFTRDRVCVKEILNELYGVSGKVDLRDSARINKILQGLRGWKRQKSVIRIKGYGLQRGYYRDTEFYSSI
ncbi:virulence-associated E family protein [Clostridium kluyveri]|uniref:virulence-associated E family protein n=1 Tax=Clostridium kluyveri TaxID=1534 RepID=UPI0022469E15|nr:virulence-associated E family protein [Clostridium kluyveri]UZQ49092.1 virulence-associated E family protein [Clostridium kluyveri]